MTGSSRALSRRSFAVRAFGSLAAFDLASSAHGQAPASAGKSVPPEVERANVAVVNEFCAAFARKDLARAVSLLADNCTYRTSQTRPPLVGKETRLRDDQGLHRARGRIQGAEIHRVGSGGPERARRYRRTGRRRPRTYVSHCRRILLPGKRKNRRVDGLCPSVVRPDGMISCRGTERHARCQRLKLDRVQLVKE